MNGNRVSFHRSIDGTTFGDKIADVVGIEPGERTSETYESTTFGADHDYKEYDYGLKDGGEYSITVRYKEGQTDVEALIDAFENSTKVYVGFGFPAPINQRLSFQALVTKVGLSMPKESHIERVIGLKVSGPLAESPLS